MQPRSLVLCAVLVTAAAVPAAAQEFNAVWGSSTADVWVVGESGRILRSSAGRWAAMTSGVTTDLHGVWGASASDVWIVGSGATILRWNGTALTRMASPVARDLVAVGGCSATDVWVIAQTEGSGEAPALLRWDGRQWIQQPLTFEFRVAGLAAACPDLLVAGAAYHDPRPDQRRTYGVLLRRRAGTWTASGWNGQAVTDPQVAGSAWTTVAYNGGTTLLAGQNDAGTSVVMVAGRIGGWRSVGAPSVPERDADRIHYAVAGDGSAIAVFSSGFARLAGGQWTVTSGEISSDALMPASRQRQLEELSRRLQAQAAAGQGPTIEQMRQLQELSQDAQQMSENATALTQRAASLAYGRMPAVWAPATGTDFIVATRTGQVFRVSGTTSQRVFDMTCATCAPGGGAAAPAAPAPAPARRSNIPTPTRRVKP